MNADTSTARPAPTPAKLIAAFAAVYVIWGSTYLGIRFAIEDLPPFIMASTRFLIAGALLYAWMRLRGAPRPTRVHWRNAAIVGVLLLTISNGAVVWAERTVPSGLASVMVATLPMWMAFLEWVGDHSKRPSSQIVAGIVLGLIGVGVLIGPGLRAAGEPVDAFGAALLLGASVSWAAGSLYGRKADLPRSAPLATAMEMLCGGAVLFAISLARGDWHGFDPSQVSAPAWIAFVYLIVFGSLIALSAYVWLLTATTPARVSTYAYVNPVVAVFLGWLIAGEALSPRTWIAAALIITAVMVITTYRSRVVPAGRSAEPPLPSRNLPGTRA